MSCFFFSPTSFQKYTFFYLCVSGTTGKPDRRTGTIASSEILKQADSTRPNADHRNVALTKVYALEICPSPVLHFIREEKIAT